MLMKPHCTFTIPSVHDELELQGRLYFPRRSPSADRIVLKGFAIFAHPYAPLGGSWDDPVVRTVGAILLRQGFLLNTFNFRGARGSGGSTSWTGKPELGDYVSFYALLLHLFSSLEAEQHLVMEYERATEPTLILGGYSYGSLIASHLPTIEVMSSLTQTCLEGSPLHEIRSRAAELAKTLAGYLEVQNYISRTTPDSKEPSSPSRSLQGLVVGGSESESNNRRSSRESARRSLDTEVIRQSIERVRRRLSSKSTNHSPSDLGQTTNTLPVSISPRVAYLLISPLLPPISGLTTMFSGLKFVWKHGTDAGHDSSLDNKTMLIRSPTCAVFGDSDGFTSVRKLRRWTEELENMPSSLFVGHEIQGAGHFWTEIGVELKLSTAIQDWVEGLVEQASLQNNTAQVFQDRQKPQN